MLPTMEAGMLPRPLAIVGTALLALGLLTPVVAAGLLAGASGMAIAGADQGMTIYGPLLLAVLAVFGAGRYSLDRLIIDWAHRALPVEVSAPHVVIVGAGFGGMACAAGLRHERARVTLIDRHNYHLFQPLLYQVATGSLSPGEIASPLRGVLSAQKNTRVLLGTVVDVDPESKHVTLQDGAVLQYDSLIVATGSQTSYFGHNEWQEWAPGLKSIEEATTIRHKILYAFEVAERISDPAQRRAWLTFVIVGAGPTGVELAGAIAEIARQTLRNDFRSIHPEDAEIIRSMGRPVLMTSETRGKSSVHGKLAFR
jgi:NADH dehydrogenase FAD-containing subunit